jgi:hypothetical protein
MDNQRWERISPAGQVRVYQYDICVRQASHCKKKKKKEKKRRESHVIDYW